MLSIQYTYTANTLKTINRLYAKFTKKIDVVNLRDLPEFGYGYFFDDHEAIDGSLYFSKKLLTEASNLERRLIVIIPMPDQYEALMSNGKDYKNLKWYLDLKRIASQTNSILIDLADHFKKELKKEDWEKMVLICDGHWTIYGNSFVAKLIKKIFFK